MPIKPWLESCGYNRSSLRENGPFVTLMTDLFGVVHAV
jgi:hypothetical protein